MINYRKYQGNFNQFIDQVRLQDVLNYKVPMDQIRDRIVLVGFTSKSGVNDYSLTPVGEMAGVLIQAQMVSQLTSAVLDGRPLIWWWSFWENGLWIMGWAFLGSAIVWAFQRPQRLVSVGTLVFISVGLIGYTVFVFYSGWLPVVPAAIALVTAGGITLAVTNGLR
jgi:CHASE2 domain-containing sensor protein